MALLRVTESNGVSYITLNYNTLLPSSATGKMPRSRLSRNIDVSETTLSYQCVRKHEELHHLSARAALQWRILLSRLMEGYEMSEMFQTAMHYWQATWRRKTPLPPLSEGLGTSKTTSAYQYVQDKVDLQRIALKPHGCKEWRHCVSEVVTRPKSRYTTVCRLESCNITTDTFDVTLIYHMACRFTRLARFPIISVVQRPQRSLNALQWAATTSWSVELSLRHDSKLTY